MSVSNNPVYYGKRKTPAVTALAPNLMGGTSGYVGLNSTLTALTSLDGISIPTAEGDTFVTLAGTQALSNKTIYSPVITGSLNIPFLNSHGVVHNSDTGVITSSLITLSDLDPSAATSNNIAYTMVLRDGSKNFSANVITASLTGAASLNVLKSGDTMSGALTTTGLTVTGLNSTGIVHNSSAGLLSTKLIQTSDLDDYTNLKIPNANLVTLSTAGLVLNSATTATSSNTSNAIVSRDGSGGFSAGIITTSGMSLPYPTSAVNSLQVGTSGDFGSNTYGLGIAFPSSSSYSPFGIISNNSGTYNKLFSVSNAGVVKTAYHTLDDGNGNTTFTGGGNVLLSFPTSISMDAQIVGSSITAGTSSFFNTNLTGQVKINTDVIGQTTTIGSSLHSLIVTGGIQFANLTTAGILHNDSSGNLTSGLVSNSDTTATNLNTANAIVARDASGNFSAGTITAALIGASSLNVLKTGDTMSGNLTLNGNLLFGSTSSIISNNNQGMQTDQCFNLQFQSSATSSNNWVVIGNANGTNTQNFYVYNSGLVRTKNNILDDTGANAGNMIVNGSLFLPYPSTSINQLQLGATGDFGPDRFALGIAFPSTGTIWPLGIESNNAGTCTRLFTVDNTGNASIGGNITLPLGKYIALDTSAGSAIGEADSIGRFSTSSAVGDLVIRANNNSTTTASNLLLQSGLGAYGIKIDTSNNTTISGTATFANAASSVPHIAMNNNRLAIGDTLAGIGADTAVNVCRIGSGSSTRSVILTLTKTSVASTILGNDGSNTIVGSDGTAGIVFKTGMNMGGTSNIIGTGTTQVSIDNSGNMTVGGNLKFSTSTSSNATGIQTDSWYNFIFQSAAPGSNFWHIDGNANGTGTANFSVYNNGLVKTKNNTLDNGTTGDMTIVGNFNQTGTGTLSSGTGNISLNGNTTISSGKSFTMGGNSYPIGNGSNNQVMTTNGSGTLSFKSLNVIYAIPQFTTYFSTGSHTYSTPTSSTVLYLIVELVGAGGGGSGSNGSAVNVGSSGTSSTFTDGTATITAGYGGASDSAGSGGTGGSPSSSGITTWVNIYNCGGSDGQGWSANSNTFSQGGDGGNSFFGGGGGGGEGGGSGFGHNGIVNTGGGGGGAGSVNGSSDGGGGGAGAYWKFMIPNPSGNYTAFVGTGGAGGFAGSPGVQGGSGGDGVVIITAYFQ